MRFLCCWHIGFAQASTRGDKYHRWKARLYFSMSHARREMILVVDNDAECLDNMGNALADLGYGCITTTDPLEALKIVAQQPQLEMMVCDYKLPILNGITLIQQARQTNPDMRAVIMAESDEIERVPDSISLLTKPIAFKAFALMLYLS